MTRVMIENELCQKIEADLDGTVYLAEESPEVVLGVPGVITVSGSGVQTAYFNPIRIDQPSIDGKYCFKLINPIPETERLQNIEDALVELYELMEAANG